MSTLTNMPAQAVLPLSAYSLVELRQASEATEQTLLHANLGSCTDKDGVLNEIARSFEFGNHFGCNLDALYDCVTDLEPDRSASKPGFVIILEALPNTAAFDADERNRLLDVFRDAADYFDDTETAFRVFYSVAA